MRNKIIYIAHFGPVYSRKINVYIRKALACDPSDTFYEYAWSTNAYPTCKEALKAAKAEYPSKTFKVSFK